VGGQKANATCPFVLVVRKAKGAWASERTRKA